jgi:hypothetical protein
MAIVRAWHLGETGSVAPGQMGGHRPKAISGEQPCLVAGARRAKGLHLRGLVAERGLKVDDRAVWTFIHAEKLSFKKTVAASQRDRPDVAPRRVRWRKYQDRIEPERLVFIETWTRAVIMDKSGSRKANAVRHFIRIADAKLFSPPKYSPDLNLIE